MKRFLFVLMWCSVWPFLLYSGSSRLAGCQCQDICRSVSRETFGHYVMRGIGDVLKDGVQLNRNLVSLDTIKIATGFTPAYVATRFIDEPIQNHFYDPDKHKNINQMPSTFCRVVEEGAFGIMIALSSLAFFGRSDKARITGRIFGIGAVSALLGKRIVKGFKFKGGKRPWHECFSDKKRSDGGFPSGHMVEAAYSATVFGWQYGYMAAIPLSMYAAVMFGVSVNRNRHYVSQVIAGTAVGVMYGVAASRLIDRRLDEHVRLCMSTDACGAPQLMVSYRF